jgi:flagellar basal body-associated protein FliL
VFASLGITVVEDPMQNTSSKPKRSTLSKILIGALAIVIACCGLSVLGAVLSPSQPATATPAPAVQDVLIEPTATEPTATEPPAAAPTEQATAAPAEAPTAAPTVAAVAAPDQVSAGGGTIPGLQPADITVNLEQRDFTCEAAEPTPSGNYYVWRCKSEKPALQYESSVEVWGRSLQSVDYIDATVIQYSDEDLAAMGILGFIATMPYDNAQPRDAREWVATTMGTITEPGVVKETEFAGVPYRLYGLQTVRTLEMGSIEEK